MEEKFVSREVQEVLVLFTEFIWPFLYQSSFFNPLTDRNNYNNPFKIMVFLENC